MEDLENRQHWSAIVRKLNNVVGAERASTTSLTHKWMEICMAAWRCISLMSSLDFKHRPQASPALVKTIITSDNRMQRCQMRGDCCISVGGASEAGSDTCTILLENAQTLPCTSIQVFM